MVWTLALSISIEDQVDKVGAYAGVAACLGLAILSILYFAQAREVRRLREWAGRAPERAQELEARVMAGARDAQVSTPAVTPEAVGTAPPIEDGTTDEGAGERPLPADGEQAVPTAVPAGAVPAGVAAEHRPVDDADGAQAAAAGSADGATDGQDAQTGSQETERPAERSDPVLIPPGAATPAGAAAAAVAAGAAAPGARTEPAASVTAAGSSATAPALGGAAGAGPPAGAPAGIAPALGGPAGAGPAPAAPAGTGPAARGSESTVDPPGSRPAFVPPGDDAPGQPEAAGRSAAGGPAAGIAGPSGATPATRGAGDAPVRLPRPATLPPSTPAAGRQPRPAAPLRNPRPSATPRRPAGAAPSSPARGRRSRTPLYAGAGLLAAAGLAAGIIAVTGGGEEPRRPAANTAATPTATPEAASTAQAERGETMVAVLNGTTQNGLASTISQQLVSAGFQKGDIATNTDQTREETVVLYGARARTAARDVARILEATRIEALDPETEALAGQGGNKPDVVVVVGADQAP